MHHHVRCVPHVYDTLIIRAFSIAEGDQIWFPLMPKEIQTLRRVRQSWDVGRVGVVAVTSSWLCRWVLLQEARMIIFYVSLSLNKQRGMGIHSTGVNGICCLSKGHDQQSGIRK